MAPAQDASELPRTLTCPACGYHVAVPLFQGGRGVDVVRCVDCGHIFNGAVDRATALHADQRSRTFSAAPGWREHVRVIHAEMLARLPASPVVVEVGHGDAAFLTTLAEARATGRYVGFDPHGARESAHAAVELRADRFMAAQALADLSPHLIVSRYVMEYVAHPLGFVQELAFAAAWAGIQPLVYVEVPCIDRALETRRTLDFDAEHTSYFTTASFMKMLSRCGVVEQRIGHGYRGEIVYAFVRLGRGQAQLDHARGAESFRRESRESLMRLRRQLDALSAAGRSVAIWGGTGEAAAFIAQAGMDARRFPIVVESDAAAVDTVVPATGQVIRSSAWLRANPVDVVIIPAQRRARDIVREMAACDIRCDQLLVDDGGRLVDYVPDAPRDIFAGAPALAFR